MKTGLKILLLVLTVAFTGLKAQNNPNNPGSVNTGTNAVKTGTNAVKTNTGAVKTGTPNYIQFSGFVADVDSLAPIPFVSIIIKGTSRGTTSNWNGFFSLVLSPGDELEFRSFTHQTSYYKISDTLSQKYYFAVQVLTKDTVQLENIDVFPWPSKEDFKRAFLALNLNETDADRATRNLSSGSSTFLERNQPASASENYRYVMQAYYTKLYTMGQQPSISLLNPIAWASFIDALRNKKKKKSTDDDN